MTINWKLWLITYVCLVLLMSGLTLADVLPWRIYLVLLIGVSTFTGWLAWVIHQRNAARDARTREEEQGDWQERFR